jgi:hypothetical protein
MRSLWLAVRTRLMGAVGPCVGAATPVVGPIGRRGGVRSRRLGASLLLAAAFAAAPGAATPCAAAGGAKPARKPGVSFLLSVILPGAGQLYNGDDRGYLYLGVEAAAWFARFSYRDAGNKKETEFERYADLHWTLNLYRASSGILGANYTTENDSLIVWFFDHDQQQYYEEIGKYDKFRAGWDDWAATYDPSNNRALSPNRAHYRDMRQQSNDLLGRARLALAAALVNRVVSGVDAFRTARGRSPGAQGSSLRLESGFHGGEDPQATLALVKVLR